MEILLKNLSVTRNRTLVKNKGTNTVQIFAKFTAYHPIVTTRARFILSRFSRPIEIMGPGR